MVFAQTLVPSNKIAAFCKRWKVDELALFGSAVCDDFSPQSDIDLLVSFASHSDWSLFDHIQMKLELKKLSGHKVDLVTRRALEKSGNALLRAEILNSARVLSSKQENPHVQTLR